MPAPKAKALAVEVFRSESFGIKAAIDETSLLIPDGTPFEVAEKMLAAMKGVRNCTLWWIGDLLLFAERAYGEKYAQLLDATDFEYSTLRNVCYVVTHVAPGTRRKELTFWHHQEIAALTPDKQKKFLKIAVEQHLSVAALRALIKDKPQDSKPNRAETFELALRSILKLAQQSKDFDKKAFADRDANSRIHEVVMIALTASDALKAFEE
jgi:hypothetical protein